jgi:hypothetical protein
VLELRDAGGRLKERREQDNLITTAGKTFFASRLIGASMPVLSHIAVGAGTAAAAVGDTALAAEVARVVMSLTSNVVNVVDVRATFGAGVGTGAITEAGLINAATGGTLVARTVFAVVNKAATDTLSYTWTITFT